MASAIRRGMVIYRVVCGGRKRRAYFFVTKAKAQRAIEIFRRKSKVCRISRMKAR